MGKVPTRIGNFFCGVTPEEKYANYLKVFMEKTTEHLLKMQGLPPDLVVSVEDGQDLSQFPADAGG